MACSRCHRRACSCSLVPATREDERGMASARRDAEEQVARLVVYRLDDPAGEQDRRIQDDLHIRGTEPVLRLALGAVAGVPLHLGPRPQPLGDVRCGRQPHRMKHSYVIASHQPRHAGCPAASRRPVTKAPAGSALGRALTVDERRRIRLGDTRAGTSSGRTRTGSSSRRSRQSSGRPRGAGRSAGASAFLGDDAEDRVA